MEIFSFSHLRSQERRRTLVSSHVPHFIVTFFCAAEEKQVALPEAAVSHGRAVQFPAELRSQPSTIRLAFFFHPSKEALAPGRLISFGMELS